MRVYSNFEKQLMKKIGAVAKTEKLPTMTMILKDMLKIKCQVQIVGRSPEYNLKENEQHYYKIEVKGDEDEWLADYFEITDRFWETSNLFEFLLKNGYLLKKGGAKYVGMYINMQKDILDETREVPTYEVHITDELLQFMSLCGYYFYPTAELIDLVKNGFKTRSDRYSYYTRVIAICAATFTGLGLILNIFSSSRKEMQEVQTIRIDSVSLNFIKQNFIPKSNTTTVVKIDSTAKGTSSVLKETKIPGKQK